MAQSALKDPTKAKSKAEEAENRAAQLFFDETETDTDQQNQRDQQNQQDQQTRLTQQYTPNGTIDWNRAEWSTPENSDDRVNSKSSQMAPKNLLNRFTLTEENQASQTPKTSQETKSSLSPQQSQQKTQSSLLQLPQNTPASSQPKRSVRQLSQSSQSSQSPQTSPKQKTFSGSTRMTSGSDADYDHASNTSDLDEPIAQFDDHEYFCKKNPKYVETLVEQLNLSDTHKQNQAGQAGQVYGNGKGKSINWRSSANINPSPIKSPIQSPAKTSPRRLRSSTKSSPYNAQHNVNASPEQQKAAKIRQNQARSAAKSKSDKSKPNDPNVFRTPRRRKWLCEIKRLVSNASWGDDQINRKIGKVEEWYNFIVDEEHKYRKAEKIETDKEWYQYIKDDRDLNNFGRFCKSIALEKGKDSKKGRHVVRGIANTNDQEDDSNSNSNSQAKSKSKSKSPKLSPKQAASVPVRLEDMSTQDLNSQIFDKTGITEQTLNLMQKPNKIKLNDLWDNSNFKFFDDTSEWLVPQIFLKSFVANITTKELIQSVKHRTKKNQNLSNFQAFKKLREENKQDNVNKLDKLYKKVRIAELTPTFCYNQILCKILAWRKQFNNIHDREMNFKVLAKIAQVFLRGKPGKEDDDTVLISSNTKSSTHKLHKLMAESVDMSVLDICETHIFSQVTRDTRLDDEKDFQYKDKDSFETGLNETYNRLHTVAEDVFLNLAVGIGKESLYYIFNYYDNPEQAKQALKDHWDNAKNYKNDQSRHPKGNLTYLQTKMHERLKEFTSDQAEQLKELLDFFVSMWVDKFPTANLRRKLACEMIQFKNVAKNPLFYLCDKKKLTPKEPTPEIVLGADTDTDTINDTGTIDDANTIDDSPFVLESISNNIITTRPKHDESKSVEDIRELNMQELEKWMQSFGSVDADVNALKIFPHQTKLVNVFQQEDGILANHSTGSGKSILALMSIRLFLYGMPLYKTPEYDAPIVQYQKYRKENANNIELQRLQKIYGQDEQAFQDFVPIKDKIVIVTKASLKTGLRDKLKFYLKSDMQNVCVIAYTDLVNIVMSRKSFEQAEAKAKKAKKAKNAKKSKQVKQVKQAKKDDSQINEVDDEVEDEDSIDVKKMKIWYQNLQVQFRIPNLWAEKNSQDSFAEAARIHANFMLILDEVHYLRNFTNNLQMEDIDADENQEDIEEEENENDQLLAEQLTRDANKTQTRKQAQANESAQAQAKAIAKAKAKDELQAKPKQINDLDRCLLLAKKCQKRLVLTATPFYNFVKDIKPIWSLIWLQLPIRIPKPQDNISTDHPIMQNIDYFCKGVLANIMKQKQSAPKVLSHLRDQIEIIYLGEKPKRDYFPKAERPLYDIDKNQKFLDSNVTWGEQYSPFATNMPIIERNLFQTFFDKDSYSYYNAKDNPLYNTIYPDSNYHYPTKRFADSKATSDQFENDYVFENLPLRDNDQYNDFRSIRDNAKSKSSSDYANAKNSYEVEVGSTKASEASNVTGVGFYSSKLASNTVGIKQNPRTVADFENNPKIAWIYKELYDNETTNIHRTPGKTMIFSNFVDCGIDILNQALIAKNNSVDDPDKRYEINIITGKVSMKKRLDIVEKYNNKKYDSRQILLMSAAGTEGLDCKLTKKVILYEPPWSEALLEQSAGRAIRTNSHIYEPQPEQYEQSSSKTQIHRTVTDKNKRYVTVKVLCIDMPKSNSKRITIIDQKIVKEYIEPKRAIIDVWLQMAKRYSIEYNNLNCDEAKRSKYAQQMVCQSDVSDFKLFSVHKYKDHQLDTEKCRNNLINFKNKICKTKPTKLEEDSVAWANSIDAVCRNSKTDTKIFQFELKRVAKPENRNKQNQVIDEDNEDDDNEIGNTDGDNLLVVDDEHKKIVSENEAYRKSRVKNNSSNDSDSEENEGPNSVAVPNSNSNTNTNSNANARPTRQVTQPKRYQD